MGERLSTFGHYVMCVFPFDHGASHGPEDLIMAHGQRIDATSASGSTLASDHGASHGPEDLIMAHGQRIDASHRA